MVMKSEKPTDLLYTLGLTGKRATGAAMLRGTEAQVMLDGVPPNRGSRRLGSTCLLAHTLGDGDLPLISASASPSSAFGGDSPKREAITDEARW